MTKTSTISLILFIGICTSCQPANISPHPDTPIPEPAATGTQLPVPLASTQMSSEKPETNAIGMLAFYSDRDGNPEIFSMKADGSDLTRITSDPAFDDSPAISPDGSKISFDADYDGDGFYEIYTIHPDGTNLPRLTSNAANDQFATGPPSAIWMGMATSMQSWAGSGAGRFNLTN